MLVVDASYAVRALGAVDGFGELADDALVAPPLLWPEARSVLHARLARGELAREDAYRARERLEAGPLDQRHPPELGREAWRMADELGWVRTYDAEYVALASLLECRLVTIDARLRRGADRLGFVVGPGEL